MIVDELTGTELQENALLLKIQMAIPHFLSDKIDKVTLAQQIVDAITQLGASKKQRVTDIINQSISEEIKYGNIEQNEADIKIDALNKEIETAKQKRNAVDTQANRPPNMAESNGSFKDRFNQALSTIGTPESKKLFLQLQQNNPDEYTQLLQSVVLNLRNSFGKGKVDYNWKENELLKQQQNRLVYALNIPGMKELINDIVTIPKLPSSIRAELSNVNSMNDNQIFDLAQRISDTGYFQKMKEKTENLKSVIMAFGGSGILDANGVFTQNDPNKNLGAAGALVLYQTNYAQNLTRLKSAYDSGEVDKVKIVRSDLDTLRYLQSLEIRVPFPQP